MCNLQQLDSVAGVACITLGYKNGMPMGTILSVENLNTPMVWKLPRCHGTEKNLTSCRNWGQDQITSQPEDICRPDDSLYVLCYNDTGTLKTAPCYQLHDTWNRLKYH